MPFNDTSFSTLNAATVWDELIANPRAPLSYGQRLKDAVALDTFIAARITDISKISSVAIAAGDAANSIAQKLRGAVDNQGFLSAITNQTERTSVAENITVTETPPASSLSMYMVFTESMPAAITALNFSANSGVNYVDMGGIPTPAGSMWLIDAGATGIGIACFGATGRWQYTTPATVGSYIMHIIGASVS